MHLCAATPMHFLSAVDTRTKLTLKGPSRLSSNWPPALMRLSKVATASASKVQPPQALFGAGAGGDWAVAAPVLPASSAEASAIAAQCGVSLGSGGRNVRRRRQAMARNLSRRQSLVDHAECVKQHISIGLAFGTACGRPAG
jgi:hypothetical protein